MDMNLSKDLETFRDEVRHFCREVVPADIKSKVKTERFSLSAEDQKLFARLLYAQGGWSCPGWPQEWEGPGWSYPQQYLFERELSLGDAPRINQFGSSMLGPALMEFGTDEQKQRFLPPIVRGDVLWCQGYSEPEAGSDLASLQCKAVREGDEYVINGSKIWTSDAHLSDWLFGLFRTDSSGKKQQGITVLLMDMNTPGIEVRPIIKFDGMHEVNQTFFTDVRVPVEQRLGDENDGWTVAKHILGNERFGTAEVSRTAVSVERLREIASTQRKDGESLIDDDSFATRLAQAEIDLKVLETTEMRFLFGQGGPDAMSFEASMLKIKGTEAQQMISELTVEALAYYAQPSVPEQLEHGYNDELVGGWETGYAARSYFALRAASIYSGSNEIQRNILTKMVLGL